MARSALEGSIFLLGFIENCYANKFPVFIKIYFNEFILYLQNPNGSDLLQQLLSLHSFEEFGINLFQIFLKTLEELDEETRILFLFQLKLQIESKFVNVRESLDDERSYINIEWELERYKNIKNHSIVTTLGTCIDCGGGISNSIDIIDFLKLFTIKEEYLDDEETGDKMFTRSIS